MSLSIDASDKHKVAGAVIPNVRIDGKIAVGISRNKVGLGQLGCSDRDCMGETADI